MKRLYLLIPLLLVMLSVAFFVRATCTPADSGTAGNDTIVCDAANQPAASVEGQDGNDTIIIDSSVTTNQIVSGDVNSPAAGSGNDVIVNNGTVNNAVLGDSFSGDGSGNDIIANNGTINGTVYGDTGNVAVGSGSDTITNNGTIVGGINGDGGFGTGTGNDTITNNGLVSGPIVGDSFGGNSSGDDTIINNNTIGGTVYGDTGNTADGSGDDTIINNGLITGDVYTDASFGTGSGDDTFVNNGTVGAVYADDFAGNGTGNDVITNSGTVGGNIIAGGGNDTVIIEGNYAQVAGTIDGGAGYDVLTFNLNSANPEELRSWADQIAAANPNGGTLTFNGQTYTWVNFEELTRIIFTLAPINPPVDPVAVFCSLQGGINTYAIVGQQGYFSLNVSAQDISNGLSSASSLNNNVQIAASDTSTVYALPSGEVQVNNPDGFSFRFTYQGFCGTLPVAQPATPTPVPVDDLPPDSIINQPYGG